MARQGEEAGVRRRGEARCQRWHRAAPGIRWVKTWGISACSILSGLGALFVFRRGLSYFPWIVGSLLLVWLVGVVFADARAGWASRAPRVVPFLVDYTVQTLLHGLFLFLLPIYYASSTFGSPNAWYVLLLAGGALLTAVDPWYRSVLNRVRSVELLLFGFGWFSCLNLAFALLGLSTTQALWLSEVATLLALLPVLRRGPVGWRRAIGAATALSLLGGPWLLREAIPPVPLHLAGATFARGVQHLDPVMPLGEMTAADLRSWGKLWAWSAVVSPTAIQDSVYHVWRKDGARVADMPRKAVVSRPGGYRVFSWKTGFGHDPAGLWSLEVRTASDRLIGRAWLRVLP
jgi:hypothetical protein